MRYILLLLAPVALFFSSCGGTADGKVPELASEMCRCFESMQAESSPAIQQFYKDAAKSENASTAFKSGLEKLTPEEAQVVAKDFAKITQRGTDINNCIEKFDEKHKKETTREKMKLMKRIVSEMQKNVNCPVGAIVLGMGIQQQEKTGAKF